MKLLFIPFLMLAAALTANAHCGSCGTGETKTEAHCDKAEAKCDKAEAKCDKAEAKCDKAEAKCCGTEGKCCSKPEKKACAEGCAKACCKKESVSAAKTSATVASAPLMPCCAKE